jgi:Glutathione-dependent formaldehyde-activating enzyme
MATREAACHCGQLRLEVSGDPFAVSICHCLACQRRTGSAFGMQAGFKADQVQVAGSQVFYTEPAEPDLIVVSIGSFADPASTATRRLSRAEETARGVPPLDFRTQVQV